MYKGIILAILILLFCATSSVAGTVVLAWDKNTETDLAGYKLYYGIASGTYSTTKDIPDSNADTTSVSLPEGTYYFALTAYDLSGNESGYSNEVSTYVAPPDVAPSNPRNLHIVP